MMAYRNLIRTHLERVSHLFLGARKSLLGKIEYVRIEALRVVLGCMRTTPIPIVLSEAH